MDMMVLQEIDQTKLPHGVPPVPRGFKVFSNDSGIVMTSAPADKRKSKGRVPTYPKTWVLKTNEDQTEYAWENGSDVGTIPIRELMISQGLHMEIKFPGMKMTAKAPKCSTILRQEYGMTGTPLSLYVQFCKFRKIGMKADLAKKALAEGVS